MVPTDEELEARRQRVADLREQVANAKDDNAASLKEKENEIEGARLDSEAAQLEAELAELLVVGNKKAVDAGAAQIIATHEQLADNADAKVEGIVEYAKSQQDAAKEAGKAGPDAGAIPQDELDRRKAAEELAAKAAEESAAKAAEDAKKKDNGNGGNS